MRRTFLVMMAATLAVGVSLSAGQPASGALDLANLLARVGESVTRYYARAQSMICTETVRIQSLGSDLLSDALPARRLEYDLRVAWEPATEGDTPEAQVIRELVKVNGRAPRPKDEPGCMDPKAVSPEPLALLLPNGQKDYVWTFAGRTNIDRRAAVMLDYKARDPGKVAVSATKRCITVNAPGRTRGRVWVDEITGDVLRIDERLTGMIDFAVPREHRIPGGRWFLTLDRADSSIRYRAVTFRDPDETIMLPVSIETVTVFGSLQRTRITQTLSNYRRFLTAGRIVPE